MKKIILLISILSIITISSYAQLIDEKNVTVTMDLQPILQLNMSTPDQVDFVFDEIPEYYGGITKYAGTVLKVSASVSWDLYAVGTSQNGNFWDVQMEYNSTGGGNAINELPLSALELRQYGANNYAPTATGTYVDYSTPFQTVTYPVVIPLAGAGQNSIYHSANPYTAPAVDEKYIQGQKGTAILVGEGAPGGSYLTEGGNTSDYYFTIDYRILPGLPAIFPCAGLNDNTSEDIVTANAAGNYAAPGVYSMNVKYVLLEDQ
ncbi:MAG: hypothetical protein HXX09_10305 [Bacteroidetes bacterium]|nr:hypothetical protein [Bacteroidota bacterium]